VKEVVTPGVRRLLRARRERPRRRRAAQECDEVAPSHVNLAGRGTKPIKGHPCASQQIGSPNEAVGHSGRTDAPDELAACPVYVR